MVDGVVRWEWDATGSGDPVFSADSNRIAVTLARDAGGFLRKRKQFTVAVDGRMSPEEPGDDVSRMPTFSPDGGRVAWWLQRGTQTSIVIDGVVPPGADIVESEFRFDLAGRIVFAGWVGTSQTVVVDDRGGPPADAVQPLMTAREMFTHTPWMIEAPVPFRLSADGAHVAWAECSATRFGP